MGGRPCAPLLGMWVGIATAENTMEVPQRIRDGAVMQSSSSLLGICLKEKNYHPERVSAPPMFLQGCLWYPGHGGSLGVHR